MQCSLTAPDIFYRISSEHTWLKILEIKSQILKASVSCLQGPAQQLQCNTILILEFKE